MRSKAFSIHPSAGSFASKPFLGVQYQMIDEETAILNKVPQGAYVVEVVDKSPAATAGVKAGDIITKFDGEEVKGDGGLADLISKKKPSQNVSIEVWRDLPAQAGGETLQLTATLSEFSE